MTTITLETSTLIGRVPRPAYHRPDTPVSTWSRWTAVAAALADYREPLTTQFDPSMVTATLAVAQARQEWEVEHSLAKIQQPGVAASRAQREAAAAEQTGEIPQSRRWIDTMREAVAAVWLARRERRLPKVIDPFAQQRARDEEVALAQHLATAAPEFSGEDQMVVAAAALARRAIEGPEAVQLGAADVLHTEFPAVVAAARELADAGAPAVQ
jgi:hypothetical protein